MFKESLTKLLKRYLEIKITRKGDRLYFKGFFAGELIAEAEVDI
jgi:hypothetical protein